MGTNDFLRVLPEMVTFVRVAELGSFSAASAQLGLTPSAASRQVSRLEKELGVQLITRTTRRLRLTEPGIEAFGACSELVAAAQSAMQIAQRHASRPAGKVRLSAPKAFARHVLDPLLIAFLGRWPEVDVHLMVTDREIDPIGEQVDLVVRLTQDPPPGLAARRLMPVDQWLCATPAYLRRHSAVAHPRDLVGHSCLALGEHDRDNRWRFVRDGETVEVRVDGRYAANHSEIRLGAVLADLGIGCVLDFMAREPLARGDVVRVLPDWGLQANYRGFAWLLFPPSRFLVPKCRVLIDHLVDGLAADVAPRG